MMPEINLDLSRQADYLWALLPEIVLAVWGMGVLMVDVFLKGNRSEPSRPVVHRLALAGVGAAALANFALLNMTDASATGMVAVDHFRLFTNFVLLLSAGLALVISHGYLDRRGMNRGEFHALLLFATLGMMLMAGARDLLLVFIGLEVMSVAVYVLVGFDRMDPRSAEGALKYFLLGAFSSAFFLFGIALVWGATGSTNLWVLSGTLGAGGHSPILLAGVGLTLVGFGFKVAAVPFHMWAPDAYEGAPTPVTALMATGVKGAAFASFIRVFGMGLAGTFAAWAETVAWIAVVTMFVANLIALTEGSVKRMLAYSSVAHAGYLLVALVTVTPQGMGAFLFYILSYTVMTAGAFGVVIANQRDGVERVTLDDYAGLGHQKPWLGLSFSVLLLSLAGFPLTAGFLGKLYILRAAVDRGFTVLAVLLVLASLISYFYYLRVVVVMYMRPAASPDAHAQAGLGLGGRLAVMGSAAAMVLLFLAGDTPLRWAERSAGTLVAGPQRAAELRARTAAEGAQVAAPAPAPDAVAAQP